MNIILTVEDLGIGGAQVFVMRLAQALQNAGHKVLIYSHYAHLGNAALRAQLAPGVAVYEYGQKVPQLDYFLRKAEGLLRRLGLRINLRERLVSKKLRALVHKYQSHVVNSHTIKADYVAARALAVEKQAALVITMHGCYELFLRHTNAAEVVPKGQYALQKAKAFIYLTDKNLEIFTTPAVRALMTLPHYKIYNGFEGQLSSVGKRPNREALGIKPADTVFGMVARGIAEKGWEFAIRSFLDVVDKFPTVHLILVGDSDYLTALQATYQNSRIHFVGHSSNPIDWVTLFDVGLLPSYSHAESLPNSIAEYLSCGKPVVASRIGEVPQMLESPAGLAGILIDQANWQLTDPEQLTEALNMYLTQPTILVEHAHRAVQAFDKFRMAKCVSAYEAVFATAQLN